MNAMQIFSAPSIQSLGWTLLHSLWQGLIVIIVSLLVIRSIPVKWSGARYLVATGALLVIFLSSVATFIYLNDSVKQVSPEITSFAHQANPIQSPQAESNYVAGLLLTFISTLQYYLPFIVLCWAAGTILFTIRLFGGWLTVRRLKASAIPVEDHWSERLQHLVRKLGISDVVRLAESAIAQAPMVIGYFKPVILLPLGMLGGLSTEQLESIIIHELIHIRRRDYLVNLLQSILEAVFFFNPFVWIISGVIRREREHCCDDAVIALHGNPLAYAYALTVLEEARLSRSGLALSLAENKNQLLNRIKRIMEKSVKPYSLRDRFVPAILLITGLICASWLTISSGEKERRLDNIALSGNGSTSVDTTIRIEKSGRYYKKSITTMGEDGKPHEEVIEEFDGDEDLHSLLAPMDFELSIPPIDAIPLIDAISAIDAVPPVDMIAAMPAMSYFNLDFNITTDTVPLNQWPGFHDARHWEEWARQFETQFRENFGCQQKIVSGEDMHELEQMMKDIEARVDHRSMEEMAEQMHKLAIDEQFHQEEILAQHAEQMKGLEEQMERWAEENAKQFAELDRNFQMLEVPSFDFVKDLRPELVKDGYLKEDEEIKSIEINDEFIKINGKTIKESDQKKYRDIVNKNAYGPKLPPSYPGRRE